MPKEIWINLPVKDATKAKDFYTSIGFTLNTQYGHNEQSTSLLVGNKGVVVMLFAEETFKVFTQNEIADTQKGTEVLFSIDAESKEAVDELMQKVEAAGGSIFSQPFDQGWMYGAGFADLDGHRWNVLYMDMSKMPR